MIAAAIRFEIRIPDVASLKAKRAVLRPIIDGLRRKVSVSVSEVGRHDSWQRSSVGVALVTPDPGSMESLIERVRRYVDEHMEIEVLDCEVTYLETGG
jgi:uncharacterized protein